MNIQLEARQIRKISSSQAVWCIRAYVLYGAYALFFRVLRMPTLPIAGKEVARLHTRPHTFEILRSIMPNGNILTDAIMDVLYIYQQANKAEVYPYPLVIKVNHLTRGQALVHMVTLSMDINYAQREHDFGYAIDWWWRTPSSAGEGELRIGIRVCGIYEMVR